MRHFDRPVYTDYDAADASCGFGDFCSAASAGAGPCFVDLEVDPSPNSVSVMRAIDEMKSAMRSLVHEYGFVIVVQMIDDGYRNPKELRGLLETWRARRQDDLAGNRGSTI